MPPTVDELINVRTRKSTPLSQAQYNQAVARNTGLPCDVKGCEKRRYGLVEVLSGSSEEHLLQRLPDAPFGQAPRGPEVLEGDRPDVHPATQEASWDRACAPAARRYAPSTTRTLRPPDTDRRVLVPRRTRRNRRRRPEHRDLDVHGDLTTADPSRRHAGLSRLAGLPQNHQAGEASRCHPHVNEGPDGNTTRSDTCAVATPQGEPSVGHLPPRGADPVVRPRPPANPS